MINEGSKLKGATARGRADRKRYRQQAMDARRRMDAERRAYLSAQLVPDEKVIARGTNSVVTDGRILFAWRLHWPPHEGELTHDAVAFHEVITWAVGDP